MMLTKVVTESLSSQKIETKRVLTDFTETSESNITYLCGRFTSKFYCDLSKKHVFYERSKL